MCPVLSLSAVSVHGRRPRLHGGRADEGVPHAAAGEQQNRDGSAGRSFRRLIVGSV